MKTSKFRKYLIGYLILILVLASIPGTSFPNLSILSWDKLWHFLEFVILGYLAVKSIENISVKWLLLIFIGGIIFAGFTEFWQYFIPGRFSNRWDIVADIAGIFFGSVFTFLRIDR